MTGTPLLRGLERMKASIRIIKRRARFALGEAMGTAILGVALSFAITMGSSYLASSLFSGSDVFSLVLYQVFAFILSLVTSIFSAGLSYLYLNIARREKHSVRDLLYFFKTHPDRVIVASFFLSLIQLVTMVPYYYHQFTVRPGESLEEQSAFLMTTLALLLVGQGVYLLVSVPFALTYYLLADDDGLGGLEALKKSASLMKGAKGKYLLLLVSFAPSLVLGAILFYVPLFWILPHLFLCEAVFYELRVHPELDHGEESWPHQPPAAYVNPFLGAEAEGEAPVLTAGQVGAEEETGGEALTEVTEEEKKEGPEE